MVFNSFEGNFQICSGFNVLPCLSVRLSLNEPDLQTRLEFTMNDIRLDVRPSVRLSVNIGGGRIGNRFDMFIQS